MKISSLVAFFAVAVLVLLPLAAAQPQTWAQTNWSGGATYPLLENGAWDSSYSKYYVGNNITSTIYPGNVTLEPKNAVANGGFETGNFSNWTVTESGDGVWTSDVATPGIEGNDKAHYRYFCWSCDTDGTISTAQDISASGISASGNVTLRFYYDEISAYGPSCGYAAGKMWGGSRYFTYVYVNYSNGTDSSSISYGIDGENYAHPTCSWHMYATSIQSGWNVKSLMDDLPADVKNPANNYKYTSIEIRSFGYRMGPYEINIDGVLLSREYASAGNFTSSVFDAGEVVDWQNIDWNATTPANTDTTLQTRTGSTANPDDETWSSWSSYTSPGSSIASPDAHYIQYRALLSTTDTAVTPTLDDVAISYAPVVAPPPPPSPAAVNVSFVPQGAETIQLGGTSNILVNVSNPTDSSLTVPLHIGSADELKNWIWFSGHQYDENRYDLNITVNAKEEVVVGVILSAAKVGSYELWIGPNSTAVYPNGIKTVIIVPQAAGALGNVPDLSFLSFLLIPLCAVLIPSKKRYGPGES